MQAQCDKNTPLSLACHGDHLDTIQLLLSYPYDVNVKEKDLNMPIHYTTYSGNYEATKLLLEHGADAEAQSKIKSTPLWYAVLSGNLHLVHLLLQYNVTVNVASRGMYHHTKEPTIVPIFVQDKTPLQVAARLTLDSEHDTYTIFKLLLLAGAQCDAETDPWLQLNIRPSISGDNAMQARVHARLREFLSAPQSLKCIARIAIRALLGSKLRSALSQLEIPRDLNDFLIMKEL